MINKDKKKLRRMSQWNNGDETWAYYFAHFHAMFYEFFMLL